MGKPTTTQIPYKDDPDAVSMHTTPDDYDYAEAQPSADSLPSYTDSEAAASSSTAFTTAMNERRRRIELIEPYEVLAYPSGSNGWFGRNNLNSKGEVTIRMDSRLTDPEELYKYIIDYLRVVPPCPTVRIYGYHFETVHRKDKKEKEKVCDFDITMSFQPYLSPPFASDWWSDTVVDAGDKAYRGHWRQTRAPHYKPGIQLHDLPTNTLKDWCEEYCASPSKLKVFRVNRLVHMETELIRERLQSLVRSTQYRGHLDITFPVEGKRVDIYSPHIINRWRTTWVRFLFYFSFLWIITWPILYFVTKWWNVYTVNWRFTSERGPATISEAEWFSKHQDLIRECVLNRYTGDGGHCTSASAQNRPQPQQRQMPKSGNANLDSAVSFIQGGVNMWNSVASGRNPNDQSWGYDR